MKTKIVEVVSVDSCGNKMNYGKFMVCVFDTEWEYISEVSNRPLLKNIGHRKNEILVIDLQTNEGAIFIPGGIASIDLQKHRIWVCVIFETFLEWIYKLKNPQDLDDYPSYLEVSDIPFEFHGYRRPGPQEE